MAAALGLVQLYGVVAGDGASLGRMCVFVPLAGTLFLAGGAALIDLRRRIDALRGLFAAEAPAEAGEPFRCPVCGGAVQAAGVQAIVACGFCRSDVVLDPSAVARAGRRHATDVAQVESVLGERARSIAASGLGRAATILIGAVLLSFVLAVCGGFVGAIFDVGRIMATTPLR